jgi:phosphatidate cytidylyltransferase
VSSGRARTSQRRNQRSDLGARVLVAVPALTVALVLVYLGDWFFAAAMVALAWACLHELFTLLERTRPAKLAAFIGALGLVLAAHLGTVDTVMLVFVATVPLVFLLAVAMPDVPDLGPPIAVTMLGITWIGIAFAHATLLRDLPHGAAMVVHVLVATFVGDSGAYFGGRAFGRRKLAPRLSPNKTVEGLLIGIVTGTLAVLISGLWSDFLTNGQALVFGFAVALAAPVGDLFESAIKRGANVKDTGRMFGAHGGALDRLDAIMFTAVVGYWVWRALL